MDTVEDLQKAHGIRVVILTGDNEGASRRVADTVGIEADDVHFGLLPRGKTESIKQLRNVVVGDSLHHAKKKKRSIVVAMVGDGVNDAPAIAAADVGISMGCAGAAASAMETADVVLMDGDLKKLSFLIHLSARVHSTIVENVTLAVVMKAMVVVMTFLGWAWLWLAVVADVGSMLLVTINSTRLLQSKQKLQFRKEILRQIRDGGENVIVVNESDDEEIDFEQSSNLIVIDGSDHFDSDIPLRSLAAAGFAPK
mmetsp:Transcript_42519/g.69093  ORF Transcript_42519/g.69093 Transcript_42519/m.69093 type:complete len:254 (+) Transcript_42519:203-964(+)